MEDEKTSLSKKIYSEKTIKKMEDKVKLLGITNIKTTFSLLNIRLFVSLLMFFMLLYFLDFGYFIAPIVSVLFYLLFPFIFLSPKIEKRRKELEKDALFFFEILALSLEAGRGIKQALEITTSSISSKLSDEFKQVLKDVNFGVNLNDSLKELKYRIPSDAINNVILNIREANTFGNDIVDTMFNQVEYMREKRALELKAEISKMPIKISVVSVLFFIPLLLLILLAPFLLELLV